MDGVGLKMAERIVDHRNEKGGFASLEDLLLIQGMKPKLFEKVKRFATIGRAPKSSPKSKLPAVISDEEVDALLTGYGKEPSVQTVQEQALKYANAHPEQIRKWISRARKAHWLPKFTSGVDPRTSHLESTGEKTGGTETQGMRHGNDLRFHFKAEWHFNNLIFNQDEVGLGREFLRQSLMRERIIGRINEAYFERRRLQISKQIQDAPNSQTKIENALKVQELTAELDGLTGGWFSQNLGL